METIFLSLSKSDFQDLIAETFNSCLRRNVPPATQQPHTDELLTVQQAAQFLSLSVPTIYSLVSRLEIPCMKKGKRLYFSKDEITMWIKTGRKKSLGEIDGEADAYLVDQKKKGVE